MEQYTVGRLTTGPNYLSCGESRRCGERRGRGEMHLEKKNCIWYSLVSLHHGKRNASREPRFLFPCLDFTCREGGGDAFPGTDWVGWMDGWGIPAAVLRDVRDGTGEQGWVG